MEKAPCVVVPSDVASAVATEVVDRTYTHTNDKIHKKDKKNKENKRYLETLFQFTSQTDSNYGDKDGEDVDGEDYDDLEAELLGEGAGGSHSSNLIISENTMNKKINLR